MGMGRGKCYLIKTSNEIINNSQENEDYMIIKRWIVEADQDILFEHTRKLRETRRKNQKGRTLNSQDRHKRRKAPARRGMSFQDKDEGRYYSSDDAWQESQKANRYYSSDDSPERPLRDVEDPETSNKG